MLGHSADSAHANDAYGTLFGRERERGTLRQSLEQALSGHGGLVLVGGEAGIGKTSLVRALTSEAASRGAKVLTSACHDLTVTPPYGPWLDLFARLEEAHLLPLPAPNDLDGTSRAPSQDALFVEAFDAIAAEASKAPLVLVLEDLHWADAASIEFLRFAARRVGELPILILATYRNTELDRFHPLHSNLPGLVRESHATRLNLRALDDSSIAELVRRFYPLSLTDEFRVVTYLQHRAEGNPFFAGEMLRALEEKGVIAPTDNGWTVGDLRQLPVPPLVQQILEGRLVGLDENARRLMTIAAVIGQEIPLDIWKAASGASDQELDAAIQCAMELQIIEELPEAYSLQFTHALIREALYLEIGLPRRRQIHGIVGETLAAERSPDPDAVAYHFREAGDERAAEWLMAAGERAHQLYAWRTAAERFESVLYLLGNSRDQEEVRGWLSYKTGLLLTYADSTRSIEHLQEAERLARASGNEHLVAYAKADRGLLRCLTGDVRRGLAEMRAGVQELDSLPPIDIPPTGSADDGSLLSVRMIQRGAFDLIGRSKDVNTRRGALIFWLAWSGRYNDAIEMGESYVEHTPDIPGMAQDALGDALAGLGHAYAALGRPDEALESFARARDVYGSIDHHFKVGNTAIYELSEAFLPYRADRIMERQWLADQAEAG